MILRGENRSVQRYKFQCKFYKHNKKLDDMSSDSVMFSTVTDWRLNF